MPIFRRKKLDESGSGAVDEGGVEGDGTEAVSDLDDLGADDLGADDLESRDTHVREGGPWDVADPPEDDLPRLDLGGLLVPGFTGLEVRLEIDRATERVIAATAVTEGGQLQMQAFAAPRSGGLWAEVRRELVEGIEAAGGSVAEVDGRFGPELVGEVPDSEGGSALQPARFVGADGNRWFLRGVLSGAAAAPGEVADALEAVFEGTIVVRGAQAMAPRELLALTMPSDAVQAAAPEEAKPPLEPFRRGPEITEIH